MIAVFECGDVVLADLEPVVGSEIGKARPALVLTTKEFNHMGDVLIDPTAQGDDYSRHQGYARSLT